MINVTQNGRAQLNGGNDVSVKDDPEDSSSEAAGPVDRGWSWVICFSVFCMTLLQFGHDQAIFVLFVDFVEEFQQSAPVMTSMFTIFSITAATSSLITSNVLMPRFSVRQITCVTAILGSLFTFLLSRAANIVMVMIVFGCKGMCFGALLVGPTSLLGYYFKRRRSFATALSNTGLCAAFIVFPGFTQLLRSEYGLRGSLLILSAVELHHLALAMLLRPYHSYIKRRRSVSTPGSEVELYSPIQPKSDATSETAHRERNNAFVTTSNDDATLQLLAPEGGGKHQAQDMLENLKKEDEENADHCKVQGLRGLPRNNGTISTFADDVHVSKSDSTMDENEKSNYGVEGQNLNLRKKECRNERNTCQKIFDTSLLKMWTFRMVFMANGLGTFASFVNIYMPTMAVDAGLTKAQSVTLPTLVGVLDLLSRILLGCLADTGLVGKTKMVAVCLACIAALCHASRLYTSYTHFLVFAACVGLTCGCRHNLLNVILIDYVGVDRLAKGLGMCSLLNTMLLATNHIVIGALLKETGSFVIPLHFVGTVILLGSLLYFAEPFFVRLEQKRTRAEVKEEGNSQTQHATSI